MTKPVVLSHDVVDSSLEPTSWHRDGEEIILERRFPSFVEALGFVTAVGALAEAQDHHPDITLRYRDVRLVLSTHEVAGLTERDVRLARDVDELFI
jgi:4a-hydroxytetrahydrobiopterin dehydratase